MHVGPFILIAIGIVLAITVHWIAGAACIVLGLILIGYHYMNRDQSPTTSTPE